MNMRLLKTKRSFRKEFKRQLKYAIAAAVGFLIAFAWRDAVYNAVHEIVEKLEDSTKVMANEVSTALLITVIGVLIIIISSRILRDKR